MIDRDLERHDGLTADEECRNSLLLAQLQAHADNLARRWSQWCMRAIALDRSTWQLWADHDALMREAAEIRGASLGVLGDVRIARFGELPERLCHVRAGNGAIKWRPRP